MKWKNSQQLSYEIDLKKLNEQLSSISFLIEDIVKNLYAKITYNVYMVLPKVHRTNHLVLYKFFKGISKEKNIHTMSLISIFFIDFFLFQFQILMMFSLSLYKHPQHSLFILFELFSQKGCFFCFCLFCIFQIMDLTLTLLHSIIIILTYYLTTFIL